MTGDTTALRILWACAAEAIRRQPAAIRDQLDAAVRDGRVAFTPGPAGITVTVDGRDVADVPWDVLAAA